MAVRKRTAPATQTLRRPTPQRLISLRGVGTIVLTLLVPPVGLMVMWARGIFTNRGRLLITGLATVQMTLILVLMTPHAELVNQYPLPVTPVAVTRSPEQDEKLNALYNIETLLYQQQTAQTAPAQSAAEPEATADPQAELDRAAQREAVLNTIVYSVYSHANRYHAQPVCGKQTNSRELTVQQAMLEALSPCPDCNPPVWTE